MLLPEGSSGPGKLINAEWPVIFISWPEISKLCLGGNDVRANKWRHKDPSVEQTCLIDRTIGSIEHLYLVKQFLINTKQTYLKT